RGPDLVVGAVFPPLAGAGVGVGGCLHGGDLGFVAADERGPGSPGCGVAVGAVPVEACGVVAVGLLGGVDVVDECGVVDEAGAYAVEESLQCGAVDDGCAGAV